MYRKLKSYFIYVRRYILTSSYLARICILLVHLFAPLFEVS